MRNLIMDMLDFTRVESGKKVRTIKDVDVIEIAKVAVDSILPIAIQRNVTIATNFPDELIYNCDSGELEIIFNNLLSNAVKYNKENGHVDFGLRKDKQNLIIQVKDTGIGMTEEEEGNLFKEFMRAKNENTREISGSGLGLSILKKIVDLNKGKIFVETMVNKGTSFTVKIPVI